MKDTVISNYMCEVLLSSFIVKRLVSFDVRRDNALIWFLVGKMDDTLKCLFHFVCL